MLDFQRPVGQAGREEMSAHEPCVTYPCPTCLTRLGPLNIQHIQTLVGKKRNSIGEHMFEESGSLTMFAVTLFRFMGMASCLTLSKTPSSSFRMTFPRFSCNFFWICNGCSRTFYRNSKILCPLVALLI